MNDMLKRANLVRAVLMHDVDTTVCDLSPPSEMNKYPTSTQKEFGTSIVNRGANATTAVIDVAAVTSVNGQKWMNLVRGQASSDDEIERWTSVL